MWKAICLTMILIFWGGAGTYANDGSFSKPQIFNQLKDLGDQLKLNPYEIDYLTAKFHEASFSPQLASLLQEKPVRAVFVFSGAEGGVIFKYMKGQAFMSIADGPAGAPLWIECRSVGALIGGFHMIGIGLVMGDVEESEIGGTYEGNIGGATFATESTPTGAIFWKIDGLSGIERPLVYLMYTARGMSAGAGNARLTLLPGWLGR